MVKNPKADVAPVALQSDSPAGSVRSVVVVVVVVVFLNLSIYIEESPN